MVLYLIFECRKALDKYNIDLNQMSLRYVSGVLQNEGRYFISTWSSHRKPRSPGTNTASILDSTVSCDVTERYSLVALQLCPPLQFGPLTYQPIECVFISSNQSAL